jgi:hypothetical protein
MGGRLPVMEGLPGRGGARRAQIVLCAKSEAKRPVIPTEAATQSDPKRPPIPIEGGHPVDGVNRGPLPAV